MNKNFKSNFMVFLTFLLFFIVDSFFFSYPINEIKPSLVLLGFVYWNLALPQKVGEGFIPFYIIVLGILYDFLQGTIIGIYPLVFIITSYLCQRFFYQFRPMKFIQQILIIFIFVVITRLFLATDFTNLGNLSLSLADDQFLSFIFLNGLLSSITWPFLYLSLRYFRRRWVKN